MNGTQYSHPPENQQFETRLSRLKRSSNSARELANHGALSSQNDGGEGGGGGRGVTSQSE